MNKTITSITLCLALLLNIALASTASASETNFDSNDENIVLEKFNRGMFQFNYYLDKGILKPVAKGYRAITTKGIRDRINSASSNLTEPLSFVNHLLQGNIKSAGINLGRFTINSTLGLAGFIDVAEHWGMEKNYTNFDRTLAHYCVSDGPYIVLPFIGPGTPRSFTGVTVDGFASPFYQITQNSSNDDVKNNLYYGVEGLRLIALREANLELIDDIEKNSVDYYSSMRSSYLQHRTKFNKCHNKEEETPSYDFDFGEED